MRRPLFFSLLTVCASLILAGCLTDGLPIVGSDEDGNGVPSVPETGPTPEWGYSGDIGPEKWASLAPEWFLAAEGKRQSPINIDEARLTGALFPINEEYESSGLNLRNTGHGIEQRYFPGSHVNIGNQNFELKTFDFHCPSEHTLRGQKFPMEMQLTHEGPLGQLLVISLLFEEGQKNAFLDSIWSHLPSEPGAKAEMPNVLVDAGNVLPSDKAYYFYEGSLTHPPCTEGVQWYILRQTAQASPDQLKQMQKLYSGNSRPTQALNERRVWMTN